MSKTAQKAEARQKRHLRVRMKISGTAERPRLSVFRSLCHIYAQVIDDQTGRTVCAASSLDAEAKEANGNGSNKEAATRVGRLIARRCLDSGIRQVVFDRGGYLYHGRVKNLAEAAREAGLEF